MRLVLALILFVLSTTLSTGFSQDLKKQITIVADQTTISDILDEISNQSGLNLTFNASEFPVDSIVSAAFQNKSVEYVLNAIFSGYNLEYKVIEKQVVLTISPRKVLQPVIKRYTLSGYLRDSLSNEALIGGVVYVNELNRGVVTNPYGFFSVTLPEGAYTFLFSYIGFREEEKSLYLDANQTLILPMTPSENDIDPVFVHAWNREEFILQNPAGKTDIHIENFASQSGVAGSSDLIQYLQNIPGIINFGDGSTHYFVKGGDKDQNLILIDEAPVYNPSHMLGISSFLVPEVINDIKVYNGHIPARYGDKLSSVIDVYIKEGNRHQLSGTGNLGPLVNTLSFNGPIIREKASFLVSLRASNLSWLLRDQFEKGGKVSFSDFNAKINFDIGKNDRVFFNMYGGSDRITSGYEGQENDGIAWGNLAGSFRWNHLITDKLFFNNTLFLSSYQYNYFLSIPEDLYWRSEINNLGAKLDFSWFIAPEHTVLYGVKLHGYNMNPGNFHFSDTVQQNAVPKVPIQNNFELALYFSHQFEVNNIFHLDYGFRILNWNSTSPATQFVYENKEIVDAIYHEEGIYHSEFDIDPRVSLAIRMNDRNSLKLGYCSTTQYMHLVTNSVSPLTAMEVWMPAGPNIPAQQSDLFTLEYIRLIGKKKLVDLSMDVYYRKMNNQIWFEQHPQLFLNPYLDNELNYTEVSAWGAGISLRKTKGDFTPWITYSWSQSWQKFDDRYFESSYNQPHKISLNTIYQAGRRLNLMLNFTYSSGQILDVPNGFYEVDDQIIPYYAEKNSYRYPYHRLDIAATYRLNKNVNRFNNSITLSVYNLYNRKNYYSMNYNKTYNDNDGYFVPGDVMKDHLFYPTGMYLMGIVPYICYKFWF